MAPLWFLAGVLFTVATLILLLPWLRTIPNLGSLPALPWQAGAGALLTIGVIAGLYRWAAAPDHVVEGRPIAGTEAVAKVSAPEAGTAADTWSDIGRNLGVGAGSKSGHPGDKSGAQPMFAAIASLQQRLAKGGGSADDWELLAKSYEFLGRPAEANNARAHQLSALPNDAAASSAGPQPAAPARPVLNGEVLR